MCGSIAHTWMSLKLSTSINVLCFSFSPWNRDWTSVRSYLRRYWREDLLWSLPVPGSIVDSSRRCLSRLRNNIKGRTNWLRKKCFGIFEDYDQEVNKPNIFKRWLPLRNRSVIPEQDTVGKSLSSNYQFSENSSWKQSCSCCHRLNGRDDSVS